MNDLLHEIQSEGLRSLIKFDEICERNNLKYFMIGGTLLGAIRHRGFIPWDDDIDVAMPREDYDKFIEISQNLNIAPYYVDHYSKSDSMMRLMIVAFKNTDIQIEYQHDNDLIERSAFKMDVFPIDGTPNNRVLRKLFYLYLLIIRALIKFTVIDEVNMDNLDSKRPLLERLLIVFARFTKVGKLLNGKRLLENLEKKLKCYSMYDSKVCGTFFGAYKTKEFVNQKYFLSRKKYCFENNSFWGPADYDGYLSCIYGDYMQLPPEENRKGKHKILNVNHVKQSESSL